MSSILPCAVASTDLFSEVFLLETRRDEIVAGYATSPNQDELWVELGEINATLQSNYSFMDDRVWSKHYDRD